eukprot:IDg18166t1
MKYVSNSRSADVKFVTGSKYGALGSMHSVRPRRTADPMEPPLLRNAYALSRRRHRERIPSSVTKTTAHMPCDAFLWKTTTPSDKKASSSTEKDGENGGEKDKCYTDAVGCHAGYESSIMAYAEYELR